jgi:hypothetical protein
MMPLASSRQKVSVSLIKQSVRFLFTALAVASPLLCQTQESRAEFWPELDIWIRVAPNWRIWILAAETRNREVNIYQGTLGAHVEYSWFPREQIFFRRISELVNEEKKRTITVRAGYRRGFDTRKDPEEFSEHRGIAEVICRWWFPWRMLVSGRARWDLRDLNGAFSQRFRLRPGFEREFGLGRFALSPYFHAEFFYDSRFDAWSRRRIQSGLQWTVHPKVMIESYYARQTDTHSSPRYINAAGLGLNLYIH